MKRTLATLATALLFPSASFAAEFEVGQVNKAFTKSSLTIKVGDKVKFINGDDIFHNVFSLSDAKMFDLGSFPKGDSRTVAFEEAGTIQVECAIHPDMQMTIEVK
jgi:plastocyanin